MYKSDNLSGRETHSVAMKEESEAAGWTEAAYDGGVSIDIELRTSCRL